MQRSNHNRYINKRTLFEQIKMPRKPGWANLNIRTETHQKLKQIAEQEQTEIQELGDKLLKNALLETEVLVE